MRYLYARANGMNPRPTKVLPCVALDGIRGAADGPGVDEQQPRHTKRRKLQGNLAAHAAEADDGGIELCPRELVSA
ncbi:MAG: hypothetical protein V2A79_00025 [Planctomycetota bacterium]